MRAAYLISAFLLAGCVAPRPAPFKWEHPGLDAATAERQGEIDNAECSALAMQQVALPSEPAQTNVNVDVGASGGHMTATSSEIQLQRMQAAAFGQAESERDALANACLLQRGWVREKREEQANEQDGR